MTEAGRSTDNNDCRVCCMSEKAEGANRMISKETRKKAREKAEALVGQMTLEERQHS